MSFRIILKVKANPECRSEPFCGIKFMDFITLIFYFVTAISPNEDLFLRAEVAKSLTQLGGGRKLTCESGM